MPVEHRLGEGAHRGEAGESASAVSTRGVGRSAARLGDIRRARSVRAASRPAITTRNPARARPSAVSSPIPALAPVTRASRAGPTISAGFQPLGFVDLFRLRACEKIHQCLGGHGSSVIRDEPAT